MSLRRRRDIPLIFSLGASVYTSPKGRRVHPQVITSDPSRHKTNCPSKFSSRHIQSDSQPSLLKCVGGSGWKPYNRALYDCTQLIFVTVTPPCIPSFSPSSYAIPMPRMVSSS
ncbi:hypothetical protein BDN72DRAFT_851957 [Pluteus cervinus]|uniref:Uncharacterized protein n=1 Tax=Pluteus cervinus TaxID=181527 RepID=A0ACD2ZWR2_9AGAR|nr:hypothetical protein BDN72DRAFT_851957 [Pluteus cervinus]